jgi:hypothetical protein
MIETSDSAANYRLALSSEYVAHIRTTKQLPDK